MTINECKRFLNDNKKIIDFKDLLEFSEEYFGYSKKLICSKAKYGYLLNIRSFISFILIENKYNFTEIKEFLNYKSELGIKNIIDTIDNENDRRNKSLFIRKYVEKLKKSMLPENIKKIDRYSKFVDKISELEKDNNILKEYVIDIKKELAKYLYEEKKGREANVLIEKLIKKYLPDFSEFEYPKKEVYKYLKNL